MQLQAQRSRSGSDSLIKVIEFPFPGLSMRSSPFSRTRVVASLRLRKNAFSAGPVLSQALRVATRLVNRTRVGFLKDFLRFFKEWFPVNVLQPPLPWILPSLSILSVTGALIE